MVTLEQIEAWRDDAGAQGARAADWLRPVDSAFPDLARVAPEATQALHLRQGKVAVRRVPDLPAGTTVRAYDGDGAFLGLVEVGADQVPAGPAAVRGGRRLTDLTQLLEQ